MRKSILTLVIPILLSSILIANNQIGRYQIIDTSSDFGKILILDTTNGDLSIRTNKMRKNKNLKIETLVSSNLKKGASGTYNYANYVNKDNFIDQDFLINTITAQIYKLEKGEWVEESYKANSLNKK